MCRSVNFIAPDPDESELEEDDDLLDDDVELDEEEIDEKEPEPAYAE